MNTASDRNDEDAVQLGVMTKHIEFKGACYRTEAHLT